MNQRPQYGSIAEIVDAFRYLPPGVIKNHRPRRDDADYRAMWFEAERRVAALQAGKDEEHLRIILGDGVGA